MAEEFLPPFQPDVCEDPVDDAIQKLTEEFNAINAQLDQIISKPPEMATGFIKFIDGLLPPFDWGVPPEQQVIFGGNPPVNVLPITPDENFAITVDNVSVLPFINFFPLDRSGTFGIISQHPDGKHFKSAKKTGIGVFLASNEFFFGDITFSEVDIGRTLRIIDSSVIGQEGNLTIVEVLNPNTIVCAETGNFITAVVSGEVLIGQFVPDDAVKKRLLKLSGAGENDGLFLISKYISPSEVAFIGMNDPIPPSNEPTESESVLDSVDVQLQSSSDPVVDEILSVAESTEVELAGNYNWIATFSILELLQIIANTAQFQGHTTVKFTVNEEKLQIDLKALVAGEDGNSIEVTLGSSLTFMEVSSTLSGGKNGDLAKDLDSMSSAAADVFTATDSILTLGGVSHKDLSLQQNIIPPSSTGTDLQRALRSCGFATVGGVPLVRDSSRTRMGGYTDLGNIVGFDKLRGFLSEGKSGDRLVIAIELVPVSNISLESCGTDTVEDLVEVPRIGAGPKAAPDAISFYVFHHTEVNISKASINQLFNLGFNAAQISVIIDISGGIGEGVQSIVIDNTTSIEDAVASGFSGKDVQEVLNESIEDWVFDASREELRAEYDRMESEAEDSDDKRACFFSFWPLIDENKQSGAEESKNQIKSSLCDIINDKIKKIVEFILKQIDKVNAMISKIKKIIGAAIAKALALNNFVNKNLEDFPGSVIRCLIGNFNLNEKIAGLGTDIDSFGKKFTVGIEAKLKIAAAAIKLVIGRVTQSLGLASQAVCLLRTTITNLLGKLLGGAAVGIISCILPPLDLNLPSCAISAINEIGDLLGAIDISLNLAISLSADLIGIAANLSVLSLSKGSTPSTCKDEQVTGLLNSMGIGSGISASL